MGDVANSVAGCQRAAVIEVIVEHYTVELFSQTAYGHHAVIAWPTAVQIPTADVSPADLAVSC